MQNKKDFNHKFDVALNLSDQASHVERATFFHDNEEIKEDEGGIDTFGCLGCAGTMGGCFGCLGTAGCCC